MDCKEKQVCREVSHVRSSRPSLLRVIETGARERSQSREEGVFSLARVLLPFSPSTCYAG